jgi:hypothetical protein
MFCKPGIVFSGVECVRSLFNVLRSRTHFRRYRGRRVPFSCFALPDLFLAVPRASNPVFMFCAAELVFGGTDGVRSGFFVFRARTHFQLHRGRRVSFSCFALQDSFSVVPRASGPVFMFCAPGLVFGGTEGVWSPFNVLRVRTCFRRYQGRRVPFSSFARPDSFSPIMRASGPIFILCATELVFGGTEGVGFLFHILRSRTLFQRYRGRQVPF